MNLPSGGLLCRVGVVLRAWGGTLFPVAGILFRQDGGFLLRAGILFPC